MKKQYVNNYLKNIVVLRVLRKTNLNLIKRLKKENKELISEIKKVKSKQYFEIEQELKYLEERKQTYKKLHNQSEQVLLDDDDQNKKGEQGQEIPWFLVALSDYQSSDSNQNSPRELAEKIEEDGRLDTENSQNGQNLLIIKELQQQIEDLKKISNKYVCFNCKEEMKKVNQQGNQQEKQENIKDQFRKRFSMQQSPDSQIKARFQKPEVIIAGVQYLQNSRKKKDYKSNERKRNSISQNNIEEEQIGSSQSSSESDKLEIKLSQAQQTPKGAHRPSIVLQNQLGQIVQSLRVEQKQKQERKTQKFLDQSLQQINQQMTKEIVEESEQNYSLESDHKDDEVQVEIPFQKEQIIFNNSNQSVVEEPNKVPVIFTNKAIQTHIPRKSTWSQTEKIQDSKEFQARYVEIIKDMQKKFEFQIQTLKSRDEERLKELKMRQLKINELSTFIDEQGEKIKYYIFSCDSLKKTNFTFENQLTDEAKKITQLSQELVQTEQSYKMKLDEEIATNFIKQKLLTSEVKSLKEILVQKESEVKEYKDLFQKENQSRIQENLSLKKKIDEETVKFNEIISQIENELLNEKKKNQELSKQLREINDYLLTRPSRPEDIETIKQLTEEGHKLEQSLKENYKKIAHANEIVKYLQIELENYKQMYNIFQLKPPQTNQLNMENITKQVFGLAYQKQFLKVLEIQSQYDQEPTRPNTRTSAQQSKKTVKEGFNLALPKVKELQEFSDVIFHTDGRKTQKKNNIFKNGKTDHSFFEYRKRKNILKKEENLGSQSRNISANLKVKSVSVRKSHASPKFTNPFEDDNIIMNAERFISQLSQGPEINSDEEKRRMSETQVLFFRGD